MCSKCLNAFSRPRWHFAGKKDHPYGKSGGSRRRGARYPMRYLTPKDSLAPIIPMNIFHRMMAAMFGSGGGIKK